MIQRDSPDGHGYLGYNEPTVNLVPACGHTLVTCHTDRCFKEAPVPPIISDWDVDTALDEVIRDGPQKDAAGDWLDDYIDSCRYPDILKEIASRLLGWARGN